MRPFTMLRPRTTVSEGLQRAFGDKLATTFTRKELLTFQYAKLLNYFRDDLDDEWGLQFFTFGNYREVQNGLQRFLTATQADQTEMPLWIERKYAMLPWSRTNFRLTDTPDPAFGNPYDPYLSCNGAILPIRLASRILRVDASDLIRLKLLLLVDEAIVAESIGRMLKPGSWLWPHPAAAK